MRYSSTRSALVSRDDLIAVDALLDREEDEDLLVASIPAASCEQPYREARYLVRYRTVPARSAPGLARRLTCRDGG
jgi:hypothetical protein